MHDFQNRKKIRKILYSPVTLLALAIVLSILVSGVWGVYQKSKVSSENLEREKKEIGRLTERERMLTAFIDFLKTEQGVENEIRTKFRAIKEGEKVVVIVDNKASVVEATTTAPSRGLLYKVFHWPQ